MKKTIFTKAFYQMIIGTALSFLYMQFRPYDAYTLAWPFAFLGSWFFLVAWFNYLRHDKLSIFQVQDTNKKAKEQREMKTKFKMKNFFDYVNTPLQKDPNLTDKEVFQIRLISNILTGIFFSALAILL